MKENMKEEDFIDVRKVIAKIWRKRKLFAKVLPVVFLVSCIYIVFIPRYYVCNVMLAPETENPASGGMLSSLASSFGVNLNPGMSSDAISPLLYPDLMASTDFMVSLFSVKVATDDGELSTDYYTYISQYQKQSIWFIPFKWLGKQLKAFWDLFADKEKYYSEDGKVNAFRLSEEQKAVVEAIANNIQCSIDKKTDVITIVVQDQDPLICASMADTVSARLQEFITKYRTNKARIDMEYYEHLSREAKLEYEDALNRYGTYSDANIGLVRKEAELKQTVLENEMQLKYNTYSALNTQLQAAKAKVQERTPAFTTLQCATVPLKPAGPKRMLFVIGMVFLSAVGVVVHILKDDFIRQLKKD
mgnify:CR=1 FL=1